MKRPCNNCPFRKDCMKGWLARRATEIVQASITDSSFYCHKTTVASDDGEGRDIGNNSQICAGSVLLHVKEGRPNRYYRFIDSDITGAELVFDSAQDFIDHHTHEPIRVQ